MVNSAIEILTFLKDNYNEDKFFSIREITKGTKLNDKTVRKICLDLSSSNIIKWRMGGGWNEFGRRYQLNT